MQGGGVVSTQLANQWSHWQLKQVAGGLMRGEHMQLGTSNFKE